eukprot:SM000002S05502  [mRNA]  locus=s2:285835:289612:+ [translate_table: standard]
MIVATQDELLGVLEALAVEDTVITANAVEGQEKHLSDWLCQTQRLGLTNVLLSTSSDALAKRLVAAGYAVYLLQESAEQEAEWQDTPQAETLARFERSRPKSWGVIAGGDSGASLLTSSRAHRHQHGPHSGLGRHVLQMIRLILAAGYSTLLADADSLWRVDPLQHMEPPDADVYSVADYKLEKKMGYGLLFVRNSENSVVFWATVARHYRTLMNSTAAKLARMDSERGRKRYVDKVLGPDQPYRGHQPAAPFPAGATAACFRSGEGPPVANRGGSSSRARGSDSRASNAWSNSELAPTNAQALREGGCIAVGGRARVQHRYVLVIECKPALPAPLNQQERSKEGVERADARPPRLVPSGSELHAAKCGSSTTHLAHIVAKECIELWPQEQSAEVDEQHGVRVVLRQECRHVL